MFKVKDISVHPDYLEYPSSDGELMAETTLHAKWIRKMGGNVRALLQGQNAFVAEDLLWYPVKGQVKICKAPDVMVALGRPPGERDTYLQWHENHVPPQVVFEIFSRTNHRRENKENLLEFYFEYGVKEYYIYDPIKNRFTVYLRQGDKFTCLEGLQKWTSPLLGIHFEWTEKTFEVFYPNGEPFVGFEELKSMFAEERAERYREKKWRLEAQKGEQIAIHEAETATQRAEEADQRAEAEAQRAEAEAQRAAASLVRQKLMEEKLRALGIDPDGI